MTKKSFTHNLSFKCFTFLIIFFAVIFFFSVWLIFGKQTPEKLFILKNFPFPIAIIGKEPIFSNKFIKNAKSLEALMAKTDQTEVLKKTYQALISEKIILKIAKQNNIQISQQREKYEIQTMSQNTDLNKYPINYDDYKNIILKPNITLNYLQIWYNQQQKFNTDAYSRANLVLDKIKNGETFENLANAYAQNASDKIFEGDYGFLESKKILPEVLEILDQMKIGEARIIPSRRGLQIILLTNKDNKGYLSGERFRIKQIFLQTEGFNEWLQNETKKIRIIKLINFNK